MKHFTWMLLLLPLSSLSLFALGEGEQGRITIGVAGPHSGDLSAYGIPALRATELLVAETNAAGGINGLQITVIVGDDQCTADQAVNVAAKMIEEGVIGVIGHICSSSTLAALDLYREFHIPIISPLSADPDISLSGKNPSFFRTVVHNGAHSRLQVDFLESLGVQRLAVLHDKGDYGKGLAELVQEAARVRAMDVVMFEGISPGSLDYSAITLKVAATAPDAIMFGGYHPEAARILDQMKAQGLNTRFISADAIYDPAFIHTAKEAAEGVYATGPIDRLNHPRGKRAYDQYTAKFNKDPGTFYQSGYAAAQVLIRAIENAASADRQSVLSSLSSDTFPTILGDITFDRSGDLVGAGLIGVFQVQNGDFVQVY